MNRIKFTMIILFTLLLGSCSLSEVFMMPGQPGQSASPAPSPTTGLPPAPGAESIYFMVTAESLNLRTCPGTGCEVLEPPLKYGDLVEIIASPVKNDNPECDIWLQIKTVDERDGWVCGEWID